MNDSILPIFIGIADSSDAPMKNSLNNSITSNILPSLTTTKNISHHKTHFMYPAITQGSTWVFLVGNKFLESVINKKWMLNIYFEDGVENYSLEFNFGAPVSDSEPENSEGYYRIHESIPVQYLLVQLNQMHITKPGRYDIRIKIQDDNVDRAIGSAFFHYAKPIISEDQINALRSNPKAKLTARYEIGCVHCKSKLRVYSSLDRAKKIEKKEGAIWYQELPNAFVCKCEKTNMPLQMVKDGMLGLIVNEISGVRYNNLYQFSDIEKLVGRFQEVLSQNYEEPVQKFIENNPVMLAHFHASRLFIKPSIIGMHSADFALVDAQKRLWLIEIERPSIKLFKTGGHIHSELLHAYEQVRDWKDKLNRHKGAVFESLGIQEAEIIEIRSVVIAGRTKNTNDDHLRRHRHEPFHSEIDFMTFDELADSLIKIAQNLRGAN